MPLFSKVKDIFKTNSSIKKKKVFHNVNLDNPEDYWEIIGELGDGAYGKVYKAVHKETKKLAALKQVILDGEDDLETFMIEIDILSECKNENVVELMEAYYYDGKLWMYLEYCDGGAVDSIMVDLDRPLTEPQIAYICKSLCKALKYIHSHKVIHRDLKAGNVLLTMDGGVKLADFGVSAKNKNTYDKRGTFIGTPYWLAPEVILCETFIDAKYDYKADIWSLGISLIEFAQMDPPNHDVTPVRVMLKIQKSEAPKLDYPSKWSKEFNDFIAYCLIKDPVARPSSSDLLLHPFICRDLDAKPVRDLLLEYQADVVEEDVEDEHEDHRISRPNITSEGHSDVLERNHIPHTLVNGAALGKTDEKITSKKEDNEVHLPTERRQKGPAPPPPAASVVPPLPSTKKGPAPMVPVSGSVPNVLTSQFPVNSSPDVSSSDSRPRGEASSPVTHLADSVSLKETSEDLSYIGQCTAESELALDTSARDEVVVEKPQKPLIQEETSIPCETVGVLPQVESPYCSLTEKRDSLVSAVDEVVANLPAEEAAKAETVSELRDVTDFCEPSNNLPFIPESPIENENTACICEPQLELMPPPLEFTDGASESLVDITQTNKPVISSGKEIGSTMVVEILDSSETDVANLPVCNLITKELFDDASHVIPASDSVKPGNEWNQLPLSSELDTVMTSVCSEGSIIVRTPTPTLPELSLEKVYKDDIVTLSGPSLVDKQKDDVTVGVQEVSLVRSPSNSSLSEAEQQAVHILESVINNAVVSLNQKSDCVTSESRNTDDFTQMDNAHAEPEDVMSLISDTKGQAKPASVDDFPVSTSADAGQKLDESEVVICNSSILQEENVLNSGVLSRPCYEITLEEVGEADEDSVYLPADATHVSVVPIDDDSLAVSPDSKRPCPISVTSEETPVKEQNVVDTAVMHEGSAHRPALNIEDENGAGMALRIEGTTVEDTDVDEYVIDDDSAESKPTVVLKDTPKARLTNVHHHSLEDAKESMQKRGIERQHSVSPATERKLYAGLCRNSSQVSDRSDADSISTVSSEKENRHPMSSDSGSDVQLRSHVRSNSSDVTIKPFDNHRESKLKEEIEANAIRKKTRKRTRKFVIDGVVVTTTTSKVIYGDDEETGTLSTGHMARKQELREIKILQRLEQKQFQELAAKANLAKLEQEKKFETEKQQLLKSYETELEHLIRLQKQQVEKAEAEQEIELRTTSKKIKLDQEKELKTFREVLKRETYVLKREIDLLPKDKRKEALRLRKEKIDLEHQEKEIKFKETLREAYEDSQKRLCDCHRERIALMERQFLQQKQHKLRARENALWETEKRHLHEKHQLAKRQLKDIFFLQRHQMLVRHEKELEQVNRVNSQKEEELVKRQQIERRQLPKRIRAEMKAREMMFRESMRISVSQLPDPHEDEKDRLKKFQENEKRRYEAERRRADSKHQKQLEELQAASESTVKELEQLQNEKRRMLMEHETLKLKSQDEEYHKELNEWKANLIPRKKHLEERFEQEIREQEQFYGAYLKPCLGPECGSSLEEGSV